MKSMHKILIAVLVLGLAAGFGLQATAGDGEGKSCQNKAAKNAAHADAKVEAHHHEKMAQKAAMKGEHAKKAKVAKAGYKGEKKCAGNAEDCVAKMVAKYKATGWHGISTEKIGKEYYSKVTNVVADSPAQRAGFQVGDILLAYNGVELTEANKDSLKKAKMQAAVGKDVTYVVKRGGEKVKVRVTPTTVPAEVMAEWVGYHMIEHHSAVEVAAR